MTMAADARMVNTRELFNYAYLVRKSTGREFTPDDLVHDGRLAQAARAYANAYTGTFSFMREMSTAVALRGGLTAAQGKGVLNSLWADAQYRMSRKTRASAIAAAVADAPIPARFAGLDKVCDGRYRVEMPNGTLAVMLEPMRDPSKGRAVKTRVADGWLFQGSVSATGVPFLKRSAPALLASALDVLRLSDDSFIYGLSYSMHGSECFLCGLQLDKAESISAGYGKHCAKKHGLPWGRTAIPARVRLARAGMTTETHVPTGYVPGRVRTYEELFGEAA